MIWVEEVRMPTRYIDPTIARAMLSRGLEVVLIAELTGLTEAEVTALLKTSSQEPDL
jgi:predicted transcriptional regulator